MLKPIEFKLTIEVVIKASAAKQWAASCSDGDAQQSTTVSVIFLASVNKFDELVIHHFLPVSKHAHQETCILKDLLT